MGPIKIIYFDNYIIFWLHTSWFLVKLFIPIETSEIVGIQLILSSCVLILTEFRQIKKKKIFFPIFTDFLLSVAKKFTYTYTYVWLKMFFFFKNIL